ncbi:MAG TPA: DUF6600 domain-containing protein [Xanthomonadales bacterium]|nr:DUF6600 domain-containing protein [Xanthomonadales bacterium]
MLNLSRILAPSGALLLSLCATLFANTAFADPSGRVAYLSDTRGAVSYSPAGEDQWVDVVRNRPLIRGDRLWTDRRALAEFQVGSSAIRIASNTSVEILDLNDRIAQVQLTQGTINLSVRRLYSDQVIEIDTPLLSFTITRSGRYRIDVNPAYGETTIVVWAGAGEVYGENSTFRMRAGDTVRFYSADLSDYEIYGLPLEDDFDHYSVERDQRYVGSASLQYVDDDLVGYADLDAYGSWNSHQSYGHVWFPSSVSVGWRPYSDGHWIWMDPWGWTWVDNAPWGFAPSHYGRWVSVRGRWGWVPGPRHVRPIYAPALVVFIGGSNWSLSLGFGGGGYGGYGSIGWFPLGPREVYVPPYYASRNYFNQVNSNNTVINNTTITNVYNNYSSGTINVDQINYANRRVESAITAVPSDVFVNAQSVQAAAIRVDRKALSAGETTRIAPIAPTERSVIGAGKVAKARPAREVFERKVIARNTPPPQAVSFAKREKQLRENPIRALEPAAVETAQTTEAKPPKNVMVVGEQKQAVDVRAKGSRRAAKSGEPQPLDRSVEPTTVPEAGKADEQPGASQGQRKADADKKAAQEQERKADADKKAAQEQQRKADADKKAAQQEQAQRKADNDKKAAQDQQRKADADQQAAQQEQAQRKADNDKKAAQDQQRKADADQQAAQQEQAQRKADNDKKAAQEQQRKADSDKKAAQEQQRKADADQQAAQQQQQQPKANADQQPDQQPASKKQQPKSKGQSDCEREARKNNQDPSVVCQDE